MIHRRCEICARQLFLLLGRLQEEALSSSVLGESEIIHGSSTVWEGRHPNSHMVQESTVFYHVFISNLQVKLDFFFFGTDFSLSRARELSCKPALSFSSIFRQIQKL